MYIIMENRPGSAGGFSFTYSSEGEMRAELLDSFDYLLLNKGLCLFQKKGGGFSLFSQSGVAEYDSMDSLKSIVEPVIKPRALINKHELKINRYSVSMLDDLEKTVARGELYLIGEEDACVSVMRLEPLRGYEAETVEGVAALGDTAEEKQFSAAVIHALKSTGDPMLTYSSKPVLNLEPDMTLFDVMGDIYAHLMDVMAVNADGIINDIDIEFLHDFRVSVRRTRSAMSLVRGVYSREKAKLFKERFRELGGLTGMARDMDVYLENLGGYRSILPEWLKDGLGELEIHFRKVRSREYMKLSKYLSSGGFESLRAEWTAFIKDGANMGPKGAKSVLPAAKKAIRTVFAEIDRQASVLTHESHSDDVHAIRISFKKIRYLMEFYSSLFDREKISPMLKDMKVLQDSLGDHNDLHVQQLMLESLIESGKWSTLTATACGFLSAVLAGRQAAERERALTLIEGFMGYRELFGELFS